MMDTRPLRAGRVVLTLACLVVLSAGCAAPKKYAPTRYAAAQDRFGDISLQTTKKVYVCPTIDRLPPGCRDLLDPKFTPWEHVTDVIEKELTASGITPVRPGFEFGPGFDSLKQVVSEKADQSENAVYLGTELLWLAPGRWTVDAILLSPAGTSLFEKRGTCVIYGFGAVDEQEVTHMAIRQILADRSFREAMQKLRY
jgi:hypothetical protein